MRQFYEYVHVDAEALRFSAVCPICGSRQYAVRIPLMCRSVRTLAKCAKGNGNRVSQALFNHAKAASVQQLAMLHFNQCRHCFRWVCDECYESDNADGVCRDCAAAEEET